jgi:hypothetical protein
VNKRGERLSAIKGVVPSPFNLPPYCRFEPRCPYAWDRCSAITPELFTIDGGRLARCHLHAPGQDERRRRVFAQAPHVATEEGGETFEGILHAERGDATPSAAQAANDSTEGASPQATTSSGPGNAAMSATTAAGADAADGASAADPAPDASAGTGQ